MKKAVLWVIGIIVVVLIAVAISNNGSAAKHVIKIGIIAPQTGGAAVFGNALVKGIEMAKADLNGAKNTYELVVEDDGSNPATAASAAQKLVNIDKVSALITTTSGTGNAAKPIAAAGKIPHICICTDVSIGNNQYNFTNNIMPNDEMTGWLEEAQKHGVKKVAILAQIQAGITPAVEIVKKKAADYGITIVYSEQFDGTTKDFKTMIGKAKQSGADTFFIPAFPPSLDILGKQLTDAGVKNITGYGLFPISATPELFNDKWYVDANLTDPQFASRFSQLYPNVRFNVRTAPYGYDTFNMLVNGFENSSDITSAINAISTYNGKSGAVTKAADSHNFRSAPGLWTIKNGTPTLLSSLELK